MIVEKLCFHSLMENQLQPDSDWIHVTRIDKTAYQHKAIQVLAVSSEMNVMTCVRN